MSDPQTPNPSKRLRAFVLAAVSATLLGGTANLLIRVDASPIVPLFACWSTHLRTPLVTDNIASGNDRDAIAEGGFFPINTFHLDRGLTADLLRSELERASESDAAQRVVYLSAYATCDAAGTTLLMTQDFEPLTGRGGLSLDSVLTLLDQDTRPTLLVLDLSWRLANGQNGLLPCGVGRRLIERLEADPGENRLTLLSCSQGEATTTIPGTGRTTFGYFFEAGLNGSADGFNQTGVTDAWVSARELGSYVSDRVAGWTREHGPTAQTPHWIAPGTTDFLLCNRRQATPPILPAVPGEYPGWLLQAWQQRDEWLAGGAESLLPRLVRRYETTLLEIEQRWRAGFEVDELEGRLIARTQSVRNEFDEVESLIGATPANSVAQLEANGVEALPVLIDAWRARLDSATAPEAAAEFSKAAAGVSDEALVVAGVVALRESEHDFVAAMAALTTELAARVPGLRLVEIDALQRLGSLHADHPETDGDLLRAFFQTTCRRERVSVFTASRDWTTDLRDEAYRTHQSAWAALLSVGMASPNEAEHLNTVADQLYQSAERRQLTVQRASALGEHALAILPATTAILDSHPLLRDEWEQAASIATELMDRLEADDQGRGSVEQSINALEACANQLERLVERLTEPLSGEAVAHRSAELRSGELNQLIPAGALLETPLLKAEQRADLCQAIAEAAALLGEPLTRFVADNRPTTVRAALRGDEQRPVVASDLRDSQVAARREAAHAAALLRLAGADTSELERQLSSSQESNADELAILNGVRSALSRAFDALGEELPLALRARACRVLPAGRFNSVLDRRLATPTLIQQRNRFDLWSRRSAERFLAEARDMTGSAVLAEAAQRLGGGVVPTLEVESLNGASHGLSLPDLCEAKPTASLKLRVRHGVDQPLGIEVRQPADCLTVTTEATPSALGSNVTITIHLKASASPAAQAATRGVLLCLTQGSRVVHHQIATPGVAGTAPVQLYAELLGVRLPIGDRLLLPPTASPTTLRLVAVNQTNQRQELAARVTMREVYRTSFTLGPLETAPLVFTPPTPVAGSSKVEPSASPAAKLVEALLITLRDVAHDRVLLDQTTQLRVADPSSYVRVLDARISADAEGSQLATLRVERLGGAPERIDLAWSLASETVNAAPLVAGGVLAAQLTPENPLATLTAALRPVFAGERSLSATANVNGVRSSIRWIGQLPAFGLTSPLDPVGQPIVRLATSRLVAAGDPLTYSIDVAPASPGMRLLIGLAAAESTGATDRMEAQRRYDTARCERVVVEPKLAKGELVVTNTIGDWHDHLDTSGLSGKRTLVVVVLDAEGTPVARAEAPVVIDADPVDTMRISMPENDLIAGAPADFVVEASDRLSGVKSVRLYVGDPIDSAPPADAKTVPAVRESPFGSRWVAALPLPAGVNSTRVTAEVTNGVGLVDNKTVTLRVQNAEQASLGGVAGSVMEGTRLQPGLAVELRDADQQPIATAKTNTRGQFVFEAVKPGQYLVWSVKEQSQRVASNAIEVKPGTVSRTDLKLSL